VNTRADSEADTSDESVEIAAGAPVDDPKFPVKSEDTSLESLELLKLLETLVDDWFVLTEARELF
jgi:hypothetical protein